MCLFQQGVECTVDIVTVISNCYSANDDTLQFRYASNHPLAKQVVMDLLLTLITLGRDPGKAD